jgi:hypothetical protein
MRFNTRVDNGRCFLQSLAEGANVAWLQLTEVAGDLATEVFRVNTYLGQPPAGSCSSTSVLSVKYAAEYCECFLVSAIILETSCIEHV